MVFDLHCDTLWKIQNTKDETLQKGSSLQIDEEKLTAGGYFAQCFAMYVPADTPAPAAVLDDMVARYYAEITKCKNLRLALCFDDFGRNKAAGKISAVLTMEDACPLGGDLKNLQKAYEKGVKMIALTWNFPNEVGYPNYRNFVRGEKPDMLTPETERGLTNFGFSLVEAMNRLGMVVDVSHLSDKGFYDVLSVAKKPIVASHSNARGVCRNVRNLTDDMLKRLADNGGVTGINYAAGFLCENEQKGRHTIAYAVEHIRYIRDKIGIDHIALGSDFDGIQNDIELFDCSQTPLLLQ
ncbi:MAG: dipeptidase, partial [Clostridia bacterium]|nr:dipeptidase [Clostridia bacterium]